MHQVERNDLQNMAKRVHSSKFDSLSTEYNSLKHLTLNFKRVSHDPWWL